MRRMNHRRIFVIGLIAAILLAGSITCQPQPSYAASNVKIGQASSGENGKIRNCKAGDQSGNEVSICSWSYSSKSGNYNNWEYVFRINNPTKAKKLAKLMKDACNNDNIGYDQAGGDRDTLYVEAKKLNWNIAGIKTKCETTCASVVTVCLNGIGVNTPKYWDSSLVYNDLKKTGLFTIYKDKAHTSSSALLEPGDILLSPGVHTAMVVDSGNPPGTEGTAVINKTAESTMCVLSIREPDTITEGSAFSIAGSVESNYELTKVTISVINSLGRTEIKASANPQDISFRIGALDEKIKFGTLSTGSYTYQITATDKKKGPVVLHANSFNVTTGHDGKTTQSTSRSSLSIKGAVLPDKIANGKNFKAKGVISSNKKITSVKLIVSNKSGKVKSQLSINPKAASYDISKISSNLKIGNLKNGTYRYIIIAADSKQSLVLADKEFSVIGSPSSNKTTKAKVKVSATRLPKTVKKGRKFSFWGLIQSDKTIKSVKISVINSKGKVAQSASAKVNKKKYNIKKLDKKIKFKKFKRGTYKFRVEVKTQYGWQTVVNRSFKVK